MGVIRRLPKELVNRIAAGECVERPASVVKELVENSIDAAAKRIEIAILDGGRELIQVRDDGRGMDADDLMLAVEPHATSKLRGDDDLFNICTLGFRGEALASVAAVSRLQIVSRPADREVAYAIRVDAGSLQGPTPQAAPAGTTVEVRDLFYCVPPRRKFLKTNQTEIGHVTEQLARIALAHPDVAFCLRHNQRVLHELRAAADVRQRIGDFYGPELADVLLPIAREGDGVRVEGWVAPPRESRAAAKWEYVFVNGRYVRDRFVSHAVREAYRSLIDPSRHPVVFLYIQIEAQGVDVNVHPTKIEVRWRDSNYIHGQVLAALRDKFLSTNLDHSLQTRHAESDAYRAGVRQAMVDFFTRSPVAARGAGAPQGRFVRTDPPSRGQDDAGPIALHPGPRRANHADDSGPPAPAQSIEPARDGRPAGTGGQALASRPAEPPQAIQIHNTYLVCATADGMMLIDQHALHERILYEELRQRVTRQPLESQQLLLPEAVRVPPDQIEALEAHADVLRRLGVELSASGPQSVTLHAFPSFLERVDRQQFVIDLLGRLGERGARPETDTLLHELLDMMACKAAVKAGDPLTRDEIAALLERREKAERSSHCPHGRPTTLHLSLHDLERQFRRR